MCGIPEDARSEAQKLKGIAAERRKVLDVPARKSAADLPGFRVDRRCHVSAHSYGLGYVADFESDVDGLSLFRGYGDIGQILLLESSGLCGKRVVAGREAQEVIDARGVRSDGLRAVRFFVDKRYGRAAYGVALRVEHAPLDAGTILSRSANSEKEKHEKKRSKCGHNST